MEETLTAPREPSASRRRASSYTLQTLDESSQLNPQSSSSHLNSYGAVVPAAPKDGSELDSKAKRRRFIFAGLKMALLFIVSTALLAGTLKLALPTLDEEDRDLLHVPRSFEQLQQLNTLLKKYRFLYPYRIVLCFVITYLFLQAFSLPGSMYMSILAGAVWGPARAIPLCCTCVACGATLCYFIGAALGPVLLAIPTWKAHLDKLATKVDSQRANLIPFLIVIRIAPFPPHNVVNLLCPHLGVGLLPFFVSTWLGILGVTVIHTTIGGSLDEMTSAADFHLISWRNFFGLSAIVVAVLIPVGIRRYFSGEVAEVAAVEAEVADADELVESGGPTLVKGKGRQGNVYLRGYADDDLESNASSEGLGVNVKGKKVVKNDREWMFADDVDDQGMYEEEDEVFYDDEPLPRPPKTLATGSPARGDLKGRFDPESDSGRDVKRLG